MFHTFTVVEFHKNHSQVFPMCPNCPPNMFGGATPGTSGSSGRGGGFGQGTPPNLGSEQGSPSSGNDSEGGPFPNPDNPNNSDNNNNNNNNNNENNDTPPPPPPPPEDPPLPKGSLLQVFAAIDQADLMV